jgi:hypothetical protein
MRSCHLRLCAAATPSFDAFVSKVVHGERPVDRFAHFDSPPATFLPSTHGVEREGVRRELRAELTAVGASTWFDGAHLVIGGRNRYGIESARERAARGEGHPTISIHHSAATTIAEAKEAATVPGYRCIRASEPFFLLLNAVTDNSLQTVSFSDPPPYASRDRAHLRQPTSLLLQVLHTKLRVGGIVSLMSHDAPFANFMRDEASSCRAFVRYDVAGESDARVAALRRIHPCDFAAGEVPKSSLHLIKAEPTEKALRDSLQQHRYARPKLNAL